MARYIDIELVLSDKVSNAYISRLELEQQPTADVMEAKHGEWLTRKDYEDNYQTYACSICDNSCVTSHNEDDTVTLYRTKYCPNCGAKMDKEVY